jgi:hypothetical protein
MRAGITGEYLRRCHLEEPQEDGTEANKALMGLSADES